MAYKTTVNKACATRAVALTEVYSQLATMGWTVHDYLNKAEKSCAPADVNTTAETITIADHGFVNGETVMYTVSSGGTVIGGLTTLTQYFVIGSTTNTFQLSTTQGGAAINLSSQGVGTHLFGEGYRIYKSNGESSDRIYEYIKISLGTANRITFQVFGWWNASTHAGNCAYTTTTYVTTAETGFYLWLYGNKNLVYLCTKVSTTYYSVMFGHFKTRQYPTVTDLKVAASSGSSVTITVTSTSGFEAGYGYQIFGAAGEGRDWVTVSSITNSTQMVISSLPRNYGIGSFIGTTPSTFGLYMNTEMCATCLRTAAGTSNYSNYSGSLSTTLYALSTNPDDRTGKYLICPIRITGSNDVNQNYSALGYHDEFIYYCPTTSMTNEDTLGVTQRDSGTAESGGNTTLTDDGKSWTTNAWADKVVIITFGTGVGQIRKIASNTVTALTVNEAWVTNPGADSQYVICDEGYRYLAGTLYTVSHALREGV